MPRPQRIEYEGAFHHVMNRGRARKKIFHDKAYYEAFLETLKEASECFDLLSPRIPIDHTAMETYLGFTFMQLHINYLAGPGRSFGWQEAQSPVIGGCAKISGATVKLLLAKMALSSTAATVILENKAEAHNITTAICLII